MRAFIPYPKIRYGLTLFNIPAICIQGKEGGNGTNYLTKDQYSDYGIHCLTKEEDIKLDEFQSTIETVTRKVA